MAFVAGKHKVNGRYAGSTRAGRATQQSKHNVPGYSVLTASSQYTSSELWYGREPTDAANILTMGISGKQNKIPGIGWDTVLLL